MGKPILALRRRDMLAGLAAFAVAPVLGTAASANPTALALQARSGTVTLRPDPAVIPVWELLAANQPDGIRLKRGEQVEMSIQNGLPAPIAPVCYGLDGASGALTARQPITAGGSERFAISMPSAGTLIMDISLLGDGQALPARPLPLIVLENEHVAVDRDEVVLLEDWRLLPGGAASIPGSPTANTAPFYTVNGLIMPDITVLPNERLRLRFINGCQRVVVALKIEGHDVTVMAIDSQPAEPFLARNGAVVLSPGSRCDAFIDATAQRGSTAPILLHDGIAARPVGRLVTSDAPPVRSARLPPAAPLPANDLPAQLDLRGALRVDMTLGGGQGNWGRPMDFSASDVPAFRAKRGRTIVLALTNRAETATVFRLHGHHFRLLDRLDDGWKPYWLDTLAIQAGQTERIGFKVSYPGRWLLESAGTDWASPRLVRWYAVE